MKVQGLVNISVIVFAAALSCACTKSDFSGDDRSCHGAVMLGASIAAPDNAWFEMGCETCGLRYRNMATGGTSIRDTAVEFHDGRLFHASVHNKFDILVLDHVHNQNVCDVSMLLDDYEDYVVSDTMDYTQAFDYVIRSYVDQCRRLEFDQRSRWFGIPGGKPVHIILCSYWHDARVSYNVSARWLAEMWSDVMTFCPIDSNIGFSRQYPDASTGEQISVMYAKNGWGETEVIDGVTYGWHPTRGRNAAIQILMAGIFADTLGEVIEKMDN